MINESIKFACVVLVLVAHGQLSAQGPAQWLDAQYIPPTLLAGTLYIAAAEQLNDRQAALLKMELGSRPKSLILLGAASQENDRSCVSCLRSAPWREVAELSLPDQLQSRECTALEERLSELQLGSCVWLRERELRQRADAVQNWLAERLSQCLHREVTVCIECEPFARLSKESEGNAAPSSAARATEARWSLLPSIDLVCTSSPGPVGGGDRAVLTFPKGAWIRVRGRELYNLSDAAELTMRWPATEHYPEELIHQLPPHSVSDLVAARRALAERGQPPFPGARPYQHQLAGGSLVIVGGGRTPMEIWKKFIELSGGESARILVLPTAVAEPEADADEARLLERFGVEEVRVLPHIDRDEVSSAAYLKNFEWATGIWFGGGRQWRFVDAYWGTPAWDAIIGVARRGGAIGGSSAGATIQGDLLVRGHPLGNQIMIADGYRRGLGLLPGVAIDQHFRQRNRFDDLAGVVERYPNVLGIGVDEATALVVESPDRCSVIGEGSVWLSYPPAKSRASSEPREFIEHPSGSAFKLSAP